MAVAERDDATPSLTEAELRGEVRTAAKGTGLLAAGTFFEFATRFVIALVLARSLGASGYGLYVLSISAATMFAGVALLGLDDAMVRYVAILAGRRDRPGLFGALQIGLVVTTITGTILGVILFVAAEPLASGLFHEPRLVPMFHLFAVVIPFLTLSNVLLGVARGFRRMDYAALAENVVQSLVRLALVVIFAVIGSLNEITAGIAFGVGDVASSVTLIVLLGKLVPVTAPFRSDVRRDTSEIFGFSIPLWLSGLLRQFRRNVQNLMLGTMASASDVGVFSVVGKVNLVANVSNLSIFYAVKPALARLHDRRDHNALTHLYTTTTRWTFGLNLPFFLVTVLYPAALLSLFGSGFESGAAALIVIAFGQMLDAATGLCQPMLDMTGHTRVKLLNTILWTILLVGGGALLIPAWGVLGAAAAASFSIGVVNGVCVLEVWILERLLPFDRTFLKPAVAAVIAMGLGLALRLAFPPGARLLPAALQGCLVVGCYVGVNLFLGLTADDRMVIDSTRRKIASLARGLRWPWRGGVA